MGLRFGFVFQNLVDQRLVFGLNLGTFVSTKSELASVRCPLFVSCSLKRVDHGTLLSLRFGLVSQNFVNQGVILGFNLGTLVGMDISFEAWEFASVGCALFVSSSL